jgi:hypothetical protein
MVPVNVPPPSLRSVKERSAAWPATIWPNSRLTKSSFATGGSVPPSRPHPPGSEAATSMIVSQHARGQEAPTTALMMHPVIGGSA